MNPLENVKVEIVAGNASQRALTYKGNTTTIYAVYPSLCSAPICWAGRLDSCLSTIPHAIAFAGVTVEEAAEQFKTLVDTCEFTKKYAAKPVSDTEEVHKTIANEILKRNADLEKDKLFYPLIAALFAGFGWRKKSC